MHKLCCNSFVLLEYFLTFDNFGKSSIIGSSFAITLLCGSCLETIGVEKYRGLVIVSVSVVLRVWAKVNSGLFSLLIIALHLKGVSETAWSDFNVKFFKGESLAFSSILLLA